MYSQHPTPHTSQFIHNAQSTEPGSHVQEQIPKQSTVQVFCLNVVQNFTQLCLGGVIISALTIINLSNVESTIYMLHIVLCTVGYFVLIAQAILSFSPVGWANNLKNEHQKIMHGSMQVLGSIMAVSGSCILLAYDKFSLATIHGQCGLVALILTIINLIAGSVNFLFRQDNNMLMMIHLSVGTTTISAAFIASILAFHTYYRVLVRGCNANITIIITVLALLGIALMALVKSFRIMTIK